jgi:hypothetical protein
MALYLTILTGDDAMDARPLISTYDPDIIKAAVDALVRRLKGRADPKVLAFTPRQDEQDAGGSQP